MGVLLRSTVHAAAIFADAVADFISYRFAASPHGCRVAKYHADAL